LDNKNLAAAQNTKLRNAITEIESTYDQWGSGSWQYAQVYDSQHAVVEDLGRKCLTDFDYQQMISELPPAPTAEAYGKLSEVAMQAQQAAEEQYARERQISLQERQAIAAEESNRIQQVQAAEGNSQAVRAAEAAAQAAQAAAAAAEAAENSGMRQTNIYIQD
jgi:pyruvate/2-oxoglutarate dehydrogenase complex dihydrolipoamide acyltransferase (E2) component